MADNKRFIMNDNTGDDICYYGRTCGLWINMVGRQNMGTSRRNRPHMATVAGILRFVVDLPFKSMLLWACFTAITFYYILACSDIVRDR
jgi:hypothetical protein